MVCWGGLFVLRWVLFGVEKREERMKGERMEERRRAVVFVGVLSTLGIARTASPSNSGGKTLKKSSTRLPSASPSTPSQTISQWAPSWAHQAAPARRR